MSNRSVTAVTALTAWILVGLWQWMMSEPPKRVPLVNTSGTWSNTRESDSLSDWTLRRPSPSTRQIPSVPKRNLFAAAVHRQYSAPSSGARATRVEAQNLPEMTRLPFVQAPPPISASAIDSAVRQRTAQELADQARRSEQERRIKQLADQFSQYRLLGVADRGGIKQAFVGKGADIYVVRQGDKLGEMFFVSLVEESAVRVRDVQNTLEHTLHLKTDG